MHKRICIAIFAKTPGLTPVKTRLALGSSTALAERFYALSLQCTEACVEQVKHQNPHVEIIWAVAEEHAASSSQWHHKQTVWTGEGSLGERLHRIYQYAQTRADKVILMGSDCPQLSSASLNQCIELLNNNTYVMGPAEDGGFYLFASDQTIDKSCWTCVQYSQEDTAKQLLSAINRPMAPLPSAFDIDHIAELQRLQHHLQPETDAQQKLQQWLFSLNGEKPQLD